MPAKLTKEEFVLRAQKVHEHKYNYEFVQYINYSTKIIITCPIHGNFKQSPDCHLHGQGCQKCKSVNQGNRTRKSLSQFLKEAKAIHGNKYSYDLVNYKNQKQKIKAICKKHGEFMISPGHLLTNKYGCPKCLSEKTGRIYKMNTSDFIRVSTKIHKNEYIYDKSTYVNCRTKIKIICKKHGEFYQKAEFHMAGSGCPRCKTKLISKLESLWLNINNIPNDRFHRQVIIEIGKKKYKVDGFIPESKTIFEFYGDYYHGNPSIFDRNEINEICKKSFGYLYDNTIKKENELKKSGYNLITIWEKDFMINQKIKYHKMLDNSSNSAISNAPFNIS